MDSINGASSRESLHGTEDLPVETLKHVQLCFG